MDGVRFEDLQRKECFEWRSFEEEELLR